MKRGSQEAHASPQSPPQASQGLPRVLSHLNTEPAFLASQVGGTLTLK